MINITDTGLEKMSFEENLEYVYSLIRAEKGLDVDLSPTGPWGQISAIFAKFITDSDDEQEEIYLSRDPDNATGLSQDKLSSETGTYRKAASKTVVLDVLLKGSEGTVLEAGKQIGQAAVYEPAAGLYFNLDAAVTISKSYARQVVFTPDAPELGFVYTVTIDTIDYTYVALITDGVTEVIAGLIALLPTGVSGLDVESTLVLFSQTDYTISNSATLTLDELWCAGDFSATLTGPNVVVPGSLTEIITPVSGWDAVNNPNSGITGLEEESDSSLIIRRKNELIKGKSTDKAISNAVGLLTNVITSNVVSNRALTVVDGLPPKSFVTIVSGGIDDEIAQAIFDNMPAGIEPYGVGGSGIAIDDDGAEYTIPFSRPTATYIHVRYTRVQHPEEAYPADGDEQVRANVITWVAANMGVGVDVVRQRLETPFFQVPGSESVLTEIAETVAPGDTPTWTTDALISIEASENADFASDRIYIQE